MRPTRQTVVLAKLETTAGTDAAPTGAANAVLVREPSITPLEAAQVDRALVRPHFGASEQLQGAAVVRVSFTVEMVGSGVGGVAPAWGPLLQACAYAPATGLSGAARVEYQPVTDEPKTVTIYYADSGVVHKLLGAMGTFALEALVDGIPVLKFDFLGLDGGIATGAMPAADFAAWQRPAVVGPASAIDVTLGCTYSAGELVGGTQYTSTGLTLDGGNTPGLTSFVSSRRIDNTNREVVGKTELALSAAQEVALMEVAKTNTTTSLGFAVGLTPQLRVTVFAQAVQLLNPSKADRNGVRTVGFDLRLLPVVGNDELLLATSVDVVPPAPDLASIATYQDAGNARAYTSIPYGAGESWDEYWNSGFVERQSQAFDIEVPAGTPPVGGWPVVLFLHSAGGTKTVVVGDSSVGTIVKGPALASGVAFASGWHRNPSTNYNWNGPGSGFVNTDPGRIIQKIRALATALSLNPNAILVLGASKGNDYLTCTFAGDLQDLNATTYEGRQSSIPNAGYSVQPQVYYDSAKWAAAFVPPASRAAFLAANPSIPALPNAAEMVATANPAHVIPLAVVHEGVYVAGFSELAVDDIHFANNGLHIRAAYENAGYANRIVTWAGEPQAGDRMGPLLEWWRHVRSGATPREAMAMARARSRNAALWYVRNDLSGIALGTTGAGPVVVDGVLGGIVDGSYGLSNRAALVGSLGVPCGQDTTNSKPTLRAKGNGQYCVRFDATNDKLACALTSDGSPNFVAFTDTIVTEYLAATTTTLQWGVSASVQVLAGKDVSLMLASDTAIAATDAMIYTMFAQELSGVAYPSLLP